VSLKKARLGRFSGSLRRTNKETTAAHRRWSINHPIEWPQSNGIEGQWFEKCLFVVPLCEPQNTTQQAAALRKSKKESILLALVFCCLGCKLDKSFQPNRQIRFWAVLFPVVLAALLALEKY